MYQIQKVTDRDGFIKQDEAYKRRTGSIGGIRRLQLYYPMIIEYKKDNQGNTKTGYLQTSVVIKIDCNSEDNSYIVTTTNSIYYLKSTD